MNKTSLLLSMVLSMSLTTVHAADPNSLYAGGQQQKQGSSQGNATGSATPDDGDQGNITIIRLQKYKPVGTFRIPQGINNAAIIEINSKTFILDKVPDGRLGGLWIGSDNQGREALCGYLNNSMNIRRCYQILFRDK